MPILFVHGVNTRNSDEDYYRSVGARKKMFEELVVPAVKTPGFAVADDVYWGDLGVRFGWGLASVPDSNLQSLGVEAGKQNPELLALLATSSTEPVHSDVQALGAADSPAVVDIAAKRPGDLVRAMWSPRMFSYEPTRPNAAAEPVAAAKRATLETEGEGIALLMIAADRVARKVDKDPSLLSTAPGANTLDRIAAATKEELKGMSPKAPAAADIQGLGLGDFVAKPFKWAGEKISDLTAAAKATAQKVKDTSVRGASLLVLQAKRDDLSQKGVRFIGDVFEYLHRGRGVDPSIATRVTAAVKAAAATAVAKSEPFVLVTHSFGAMIVYDAITSGRLAGVTINLWVTVGAQTSLFAEMALFDGGNTKIADGAGAPAPLGKPANVGRWLNFYDAADVLSYLHEPVFGKAAVTDISVRDGANLANAHGHYFLTVSFYERIAEELRALAGAP